MATFSEIRRAIERGARDGARDTAHLVIELGSDIIESRAIDEGSLLASGHVESLKKREGDKKALGYAAVWNAQHAVWVHYGTRPHVPPIEPIREWVRRNVMVTGGDREAVFKPGTRAGHKRLKVDEVERIARAIQAKIATQGAEAVPYATTAAEDARGFATGLALAAIRRRLNDLA